MMSARMSDGLKYAIMGSVPIVRLQSCTRWDRTFHNHYCLYYIVLA